VELPLLPQTLSLFDHVATVETYAGIAVLLKIPFLALKKRPAIAILRHRRLRPQQEDDHMKRIQEGEPISISLGSSF
jgi:hypothetical protein